MGHELERVNAFGREKFASIVHSLYMSPQRLDTGPSEGAVAAAVCLSFLNQNTNERLCPINTHTHTRHMATIQCTRGVV